MNLLKKFGIIVAAGLVAAVPSVANAADMTISSSSDLVNFINQVNAGDSFAGYTVTLSTTIDMQGVDWTPAGTKANPFAGTFNGSGKSIINLSKGLSADVMYGGLFGYNTGTIKDLTVEAAAASGEGWDVGISHWNDASSNYTGILCGYNEGNISGCKVQGHLVIQNLKAVSANGGICGYNRGTISNCTNDGVQINAANNVSWDGVPTIADCYAGGIAGINEGTVTQCTNAWGSKTLATSDYGSAAAGGTVGDNRVGGIISGEDPSSSGESYATSKYAMNMGYAYAGGIAGVNGGLIDNVNANQARVKAQITGGNTDYRFCYADAGGIAGYNYGTIDDCISNGTTVQAGVRNYALPSYKAYVGGAVGYNRGEILNVQTKCDADDSMFDKLQIDSVYASADCLGGICGYNEGGVIFRSRCEYLSDIVLDDLNGRIRYLGGIAGVNDGGYISLSGSRSKVIGATGGHITTGGLAGKNSGVIENCYHNNSGIEGNVAAGIAGENTGSLIDCYSRSGVTGTYKDGVTYNNAGYVQDCYTRTDTTSGTKVSYTKMKEEETFANWDFEAYWDFGSNSYPEVKSWTYDLKFFDGAGTASNPYLVTTQAELNRIRYMPDKYYRLMNDIEITGGWSPIGNCAENAFTGTFYGNGHKLTYNLNGNGNEYNGLFGYVDGATIHGLTVKNSTYTLSEANGKVVYLGGIVGFATNDALIENCLFDGTITATSPAATVGGIVGNIEGTVRGCHVLGSITVNGNGEYAYSTVGGIAGKAEGTIQACNARVAIIATENDESGYPTETTGGIAGRMRGQINDSCFEGTTDVTDTSTVFHGGIVGSIEGDVNNSYSDYELNYSDNINGAIAGQVMQGDVTTSYYDSATSYDAYGDGVTSFPLADLRANATDTKYIWVPATHDGDPEPLHVDVSWDLDYAGFTVCVLTANASDATIYYTTNGDAATTSSKQYTAPFRTNLKTTINYLVVSGDGTSESMGFVTFPQSKHLVQLVNKPTNQNGNRVYKSTIADTDTMYIHFIMEEDLVDARLFLVAYDENDKIIYATTTVVSLKKGNNWNVEFTNIDCPKGAEKVQMFIWDPEMKLIPYSEIIILD